MKTASLTYQMLTGISADTIGRNAKESAGSVLARAARHEANGGIYPHRNRMLPGGVTVGQVLDTDSDPSLSEEASFNHYINAREHGCDCGCGAKNV